ncbi:MAG: multicomponent Na+:H+ antiporter subunit E [Paracoccaceae bacterium]
MRTAGTAVLLIALWLLMSGVYKPLVIGFGVLSVAAVLAIIRRMDDIDGARIDLRLHPLRLLSYFGWLLVEIAKANWAVTKVVLSPKMTMRQHLFMVPRSQKTDTGQVIFGNSITLTPGTITIETEGEEFIVHALNYSPDDDAALADMDRRVTQAETVVSA